MQVEVLRSQDPLRVAANEGQPSLEPENISDLAVQWRAAHSVAEAQERRLTAVLAAAAKLYPPATSEGEAREQAEAVDTALGVPALEEAANCAWRLCDQLAERLLALRPNTIEEAAVKYGVLMMLVRSENAPVDEPDRLHAFLDDLAHLAATTTH
jgi:hypothetical protein